MSQSMEKIEEIPGIKINRNLGEFVFSPGRKDRAMDRFTKRNRSNFHAYVCNLAYRSTVLKIDHIRFDLLLPNRLVISVGSR